MKITPEEVFNTITSVIAMIFLLIVLVLAIISEAGLTINKSYRVVIVDDSNLTSAKIKMHKMVEKLEK